MLIRIFIYVKRLNLYFGEYITKEQWPRVVNALRSYCSGVVWTGHSSINNFYHSTRTITVNYDNNGTYENTDCVLHKSSNHLTLGLPEGFPQPIDGWKWVNAYNTDFDVTSGMFDTLYESSNTLNNLIRKILKESEENELEWFEEIEPMEDLEPGVAFLKLGFKDEYVRNYVAPRMVDEFFDLDYKDGKITLTTKNYCDFTDIFYKGNTDGYISNYLAQKILCEEDDWWEPYSDVVQSWKGEVWDAVIDIPSLSTYVVEYVKKHYLGEEVEDKTNIGTYDEKPLDEGYLNWLSQNLDDLGDLIDDESVLNDLKVELRHAYEDAFNTAARDEIYIATMNTINDDFGIGEWASMVIDGKTKHELKFDVTKLFWKMTSNWFDNCWNNCGYDPITYGQEEDEECYYCHHITDWGSFISFYRDELYESSAGLHSPRYNSYPNNKKVLKYFEESVYNRM